MKPINYLQTDGGEPKPPSEYIRHEEKETLPSQVSGELFFNGALREKLISVTIVAEEVIYNPDEDDHFLNSYSGRENVEFMRIETRHLKICAPLYLPGTDLHIYAETIEFVDNDPELPSNIDTSPLGFLPVNDPKGAARNKNGTIKQNAEDGREGESAGDLYLMVKNILLPSNETSLEEQPKRFIMRGGDGQKAGIGIDSVWPKLSKPKSFNSAFNFSYYKGGVLKAPVKPKKPKVTNPVDKGFIGTIAKKRKIKNVGHFFETLAHSVVPLPSAAADTAIKFAKYDKAMKAYNQSHAKYKKWISAHTSRVALEKISRLKQPIPGGQPGKGGDAGSFGLVDNGLLDLVERTGGAPGEDTPQYKGLAIHAQWTKRFCATHKLKATIEQLNSPFLKSLLDDHSKLPAAKMKDLLAVVTAPASHVGPFAGEAGGVSEAIMLDYLGRDPWVTPRLFQVQLDRLEDLHMLGKIDAANDMADDLTRWAAESDDEKTEDRFDLDTQLVRLAALRSKLDLKLDFFGNPPGWVPNLSFEVNFEALEEQSEHEVRILLLAKWLESYVKDKDDQKEALDQLIDSEQEMVSLEMNMIENVKGFIPEIKDKIEGIKSDIDEFMEQLADHKNRIKKKYDADQKMKRAVDAVFNVFDSLIFVLPLKVLAPAIIAREAVAFSMHKPLPVADDSGSDAFQSMLNDSELQEAKKELEALQFIRSDNGSTDSYHSQIADLAERISVEVETAIKTQISDSINVSADFEGATEFQRRLEDNVDYQFVFDRLVSLFTQKQIYGDELSYAKLKLEEAQAGMMESIWNLDRLQQQSVDMVSTEYLSDNLRIVASRAKQRLVYYQYVLAKSFEYRMLKPARVNYHSDELVEKFYEALSDSAKSDDGSHRPMGYEHVDVTSLVSLFSETLRDMTSQILRTLNEERYSVAKSRVYSIEFSESQLKAINQHGRLTINLANHGILSAKDRNARVLDISVDAKKSDFKLEGKPKRGHLPVSEFSVGVVPDSYILWKDDRIGFYHRNPRHTSVLPWNFVWQYPDGIVANMPADNASSASLLKVLGIKQDSLLNFRPSAHGLFTLYLENIPTGKHETIYPLNVERLFLNVTLEKSKNF